jgi:hypothetical protein
MHDIDWPDWHVSSGDNAVMINQGDAALHGEAKPDIVRMLEVASSISVTQEAVMTDLVIIRPFAALHHGHRGDADRHRLQNRRRKSELITYVCSNRFLVDNKIEFTYTKPFDLLAEGLRSAIWLGETDDIRTWLQARNPVISFGWEILPSYTPRE